MFLSLFHLHVHDEFWDKKVVVWTNMFQDIVIQCIFVGEISYRQCCISFQQRSLKPTQTWDPPKKFNNKILESCKLWWIFIYGCFLKWWYPKNTPKWSFLVGKPMVVGYHHFRKPPYRWFFFFPGLRLKRQASWRSGLRSGLLAKQVSEVRGPNLGFKVYQLDLHP